MTYTVWLCCGEFEQEDDRDDALSMAASMMDGEYHTVLAVEGPDGEDLTPVAEELAEQRSPRMVREAGSTGWTPGPGTGGSGRGSWGGLRWWSARQLVGPDLGVQRGAAGQGTGRPSPRLRRRAGPLCGRSTVMEQLTIVGDRQAGKTHTLIDMAIDEAARRGGVVWYQCREPDDGPQHTRYGDRPRRTALSRKCINRVHRTLGRERITFTNGAYIDFIGDDFPARQQRDRAALHAMKCSANRIRIPSGRCGRCCGKMH